MPTISKACIDMNPAYISGVDEHLPNAAIVHNKFHIARSANEALDKVRRLERKILKLGLQKARHLLLGNREDPSAPRSERLEGMSRKKFNTGRDCEIG